MTCLLLGGFNLNDRVAYRVLVRSWVESDVNRFKREREHVLNTVSISFLGFLLAFLGIGVFSATRMKQTTEDYLVASRSVSPWLMALSAVATNNSGFMFIGLIGATYATGLSAMWIMVGWVVGDYLAWLAGVPKKLRKKSEEAGTVTIPSFLGHGIGDSRAVTAFAGLIVLVFLGIYSAAQLTAGSKALYALFGWDQSIGAVIGAVIVVIYCFAGGIRASIWTDAAQSIVMLGAMILLFGVGVNHAGGWSAMWASLESINPALIDLRPADAAWGFPLFMLGWLVAGIGVVGQPHIMVRAMTLDKVENMDKARAIYVGWNILFAAAAVGVGLASRAVLPEVSGFDAELALPVMATQLLPGVLVGLVLAGLFAATMSTADSQLLACSAALTQDLFPGMANNYRLVKLATLVMTGVVLMIALRGGTVFQLVVLSWSALASGLGPLLILRVFNRPLTPRVALLMMGTGIGMVLFWRYQLGLSGAIYDVLPGMAAGFAVYVLCFILGFASAPEDESNRAEAIDVGG